ncbi:MAG: hypothetical protein J0I21_18905 [Alphaproteobacteria bacterium]|nr:hypothetical protein [Alphaproteobacteria bacterium]
MSDAARIPNIDYLGRCYDIVDLDPLDLGGSAKYPNVIDISVADGRTVNTRDGTYSIPAGVQHLAIFKMSWESQSSVISSSYDFQEEFKLAVEAEVGVQGGFEFTGSASHKDIVHRTESRKQSFVFSRAYQENHGLQLDLANDKAPLSVTTEFADAVARLPVGEFPSVVPQYQEFLRRFGTHFAKEIKLGGLAFQRTSGSTKRFLVSKQSEDELKAKAAVEVDAFKAGAGAESAHSKAVSVDNEFELERTALEFRGGDGSPSGIDSSWIASLHERPAIVKATMERLTALFSPRFFPDDAQIEEKGLLLELAISDWIVRRGRPSCDTAPLRYGETLVVTLPWNDNKIVQPGLLIQNLPAGGFQPGYEYPFAIQFPVKAGSPVVDIADVAAIRLESTDGRRANATVLAGDSVRIRLLRDGRTSYVGADLTSVNDVAKAAAFTVLFKGDTPATPSRLGEYFVEPDQMIFATGRLGALERFVGLNASTRDLSLHPSVDRAVGFSLKRGDDSPT